MGAIDAQGVYIYDGTDQMVPHATYSNLLATSVSNAMADLRDDLTPDDIPWTNLTGATGVTAGTGAQIPRYCRVNGVLFFAGRFTVAADTQRILTTLPVGSGVSTDPYELGIFYGASSTWTRIWITNSRDIWTSAALGGGTSTTRNIGGSAAQ